MDKYMRMNVEPHPWDVAMRAGRRVFFEDYSGTIRQAPESYCLAIRRPDGTWFPAPDKASPINAHSLGLAIDQAGTVDGQQLADAIEIAFWGAIGHKEPSR